jgi:hypothetical protein
MEAKDAWLLFAGAFLGFVGSLLATFAAPPLSTAFGKLKSGFIERNKAKALAAYAEVRDLKSGKRDKYLYAINGWGPIIAGLLLVVMAAVTASLIRIVDAVHSTEVGTRSQNESVGFSGAPRVSLRLRRHPRDEYRNRSCTGFHVIRRMKVQ